MVTVPAQIFSAPTRKIDRGRAGHARRLRRVAVEGIGRDDADAVLAPANAIIARVRHISAENVASSH